MQIPGIVLASREIILLGTINSVVLLNLNPHTIAFRTASGIIKKENTNDSNKMPLRIDTPALKLGPNNQSYPNLLKGMKYLNIKKRK